MTAGSELRNKVAIVGFANSRIVRRTEEPLGITTMKTALDAIADAGLKVEDIDGYVSSSFFPSAGGHASIDGISVVSSDWLSQRMGGKPAYVSGYKGLGQISGSFEIALNAIASGAAKYVLFHRALHNPAGKYSNNPMTHAEGNWQWLAPHGFMGGLPAMALVYNEYCQRYGATREAMATLVCEARKNGARIPWSYWYGKPLSVEQYLAEPMVYDPMTRLDCDIPVQGAGVFILTGAERAKDMPNKPVYISGYANAYPRPGLPVHWTLDEIMEGGRTINERIWDNAGISRADVKIPQIYDGFSPLVYLWLEALGFCPEGEAHRFVLDGGINSDDPNSFAVLSGGGAIGNGRLHGVPQLAEIYLQLAGRAGERQREGNVGLMCYNVPHQGGMAMAMTNEI